jgi:hypothetical protein
VERGEDQELGEKRNEKLHNLQCSLNTIRGDQTRQEGMARMFDTQRRDAYTTVVGTLVGNRQLQNLSVNA